MERRCVTIQLRHIRFPVTVKVECCDGDGGVQILRFVRRSERAVSVPQKALYVIKETRVVGRLLNSRDVDLSVTIEVSNPCRKTSAVFGADRSRHRTVSAVRRVRAGKGKTAVVLTHVH